MHISRTLALLIFAISLTESILAQSVELNLGRRLCEKTVLEEMVGKPSRNVIVLYIANDRMERERNADGDFGFLTQTISDAISKSRSEGDTSSADKFERLLNILLSDDTDFQKSIEQDLMALRNLAEKSPFHAVIAMTNSANEPTWGVQDPLHVHQSFLYAQYWKSLADFDLVQIERQLFTPNINRNYPLSDRRCVSDALTQIISSRIKDSQDLGQAFLPSFVIVVRDRGSDDFALAPFSFRKLSELATADRLLALCEESMQAAAGDSSQLVIEVQQRIHQLANLKKTELKNVDSNSSGIKKSDFLISLANISNKRCDIPIIALLSGKSALEFSEEAQSTNFLYDDLLSKSDGNDFQWGRPLSQQVIESYSRLQAPNLGLLFTTNGYQSNHTYVDFSRIISEIPQQKYRTDRPVAIVMEIFEQAVRDKDPASRPTMSDD